VVLADEINRTTPRTQSALLEAMNEAQVTVDGKTLPLPQPFLVIATQNPVEHHGTLSTAESQLESFPDAHSPWVIRRTKRSGKSCARGLARIRCSRWNPVADVADVLAMQHAVAQVRVDASLHDYALEIVTRSAHSEQLSLGCLLADVDAATGGAGAGVSLDGRDYCLPDDFKQLAVAVFFAPGGGQFAACFVAEENRRLPRRCCGRLWSRCGCVVREGPLAMAFPQRLKPAATGSVAARLKPCPDENHFVFIVRVNSHHCGAVGSADRPGVRAFFLSMAALGVALLLALYSGAAAEIGHVGLSIASALAALVVARGWPLLWCRFWRNARRCAGSATRWSTRLPGKAGIYISGIIVVALAALNTGNNLLFLILASLIAIILMSRRSFPRSR